MFFGEKYTLSVRPLIISVMTIFEAPIAFADNNDTRPIGPHPVIRIVWPKDTPALLHAWIPTVAELQNVLKTIYKNINKTIWKQI